LLRISKPVAVAANKLDMASKEDLDRLKAELKNTLVIGCSGAAELTLRRRQRQAL